MKTIATFLAILGAASCAFAQGRINFANPSSILISAGGVPMSASERFVFAIFLAPSTTVTTSEITVELTDPNFQFTDAYTTNSPLSDGRLQPRFGLYVGGAQGYLPGSTVDFIVRGWSLNAGATWAEALANWSNGAPVVPMYIGSSSVGNNLIPSGGTLPDPTVFGFGSNQVLGFDMVFIPEPSTFAFAGLGVAVIWLFRRR